MSILDGFLSLGKRKNKDTVSDEQIEGVASEQLPELELDMTDAELTALTQKWERSWNIRS